MKLSILTSFFRFWIFQNILQKWIGMEMICKQFEHLTEKIETKSQSFKFSISGSLANKIVKCRVAALAYCAWAVVVSSAPSWPISLCELFLLGLLLLLVQGHDFVKDSVEIERDKVCCVTLRVHLIASDKHLGKCQNCQRKGNSQWFIAIYVNVYLLLKHSVDCFPKPRYSSRTFLVFFTFSLDVDNLFLFWFFFKGNWDFSADLLSARSAICLSFYVKIKTSQSQNKYFTDFFKILETFL